jgi:uncharacterized protein involved in exopolysaccharide biosynthesis
MSLPHVTESSLLAQTAGTPTLLRPPPIQIGEYGHAPKPPAQSGGGLSVGFLFRSFQQWWRIAVPAGIVCALLAAAVVWSSWTPKYRAYAILYIPDKGGVLLPTSPDVSPRFAQTQLRSIASSVVLIPALADREIAKVPEVKRQAAPLEFLEKNLKVVGDGGSELYRVEYTGENAEDAATIVNGVIRVYLANLAKDETAQRNSMLNQLKLVTDKREIEIRLLQNQIVEMESKLIGKGNTKGDSSTGSNVLTP